MEGNNSEEIVMAAKTIVEGVSDILEYAFIVGIGSCGQYSLSFHRLGKFNTCNPAGVQVYKDPM